MDAMSEDWTDAARQEERHSQLRDKHAQHCFAYIAESIWCSGDLTIEWAKVEKDGGRRQVDGWGIPHQCKNPEAIRAWMQANHGPVKDDHVHLHDWWEAMGKTLNFGDGPSRSFDFTYDPLHLLHVLSPSLHSLFNKPKPLKIYCVVCSSSTFRTSFPFSIPSRL